MCTDSSCPNARKDQQQIVRTALFYVLHEIAKKLKGRQGISQLVLNVLRLGQASARLAPGWGVGVGATRLTMQEMKTMAPDERRHYADFIFKPPSKIQACVCVCLCLCLCLCLSGIA